ncbi:MAG: hypothetical protein HKP35_05435 [Silicimonas sp.]|nr:hypothetical protein [Silicimonas sp.]
MSAEAKNPPSLKKYLIRLGGSAVVLGIMFWILPLDAIGAAFSRVSIGLFVSVLSAFLILHVFAALKWWFILDQRITPLQAIRAHFAGLAAGLCLPGAISGDAVRGGMAYGAMRDGPAVVAAGAADRLIDFLALLILSLLGAALSLSDGGNLGLTLKVLVIFAGLVIAAGIGLRLLPLIWTVLPSLPGRALATKITGAFGALLERRRHLLLTLTLSTAIQAGFVFLSLSLAVSAGAEIASMNWLFAWPLAKLIAVLPVSLNGLGVREAALAGILAPLGGDAAIIFAAGLVWQAVMFVAGGLGALIILMVGKPASL